MNENLLAEMRLVDKYNNKSYLRMTSEILTKENAKMRDPVPLRLKFAVTVWLFINSGMIQ